MPRRLITQLSPDLLSETFPWQARIGGGLLLRLGRGRLLAAREDHDHNDGSAR